MPKKKKKHNYKKVYKRLDVTCKVLTIIYTTILILINLIDLIKKLYKK